ncbi:MAG: ABC transporter permease [Deltaproteobacteria bacterium HGW-Deltaproteobacteria-10]|nr:MAG: ABC transporter permease [Deltaproteobacteria bacterium HGW-Deltaproteobacteria-10]
MALSPDIKGGSENDIKGGLGALLSRPFALIGQNVFGWINRLGAAAIFLFRALLSTIGHKQLSKTVQQIYFIGARSITIIMLVSLFTGMVLGLQSYHALLKFGASGAVGSLVSLSLIMELGPVLTAIMITARAGSAITAEIGIQRISEQIDALHTMRINPIRYLISPKITAAIISFPLLTAVFDLIGILGGYISAVVLLGLNGGVYLHSINTYVVMSDITNGFIKSIVFAVIVAAVCCYQGYFAHMRKDSHGAQAVGLATTSAVVTSCVLILVSDYVVTSLLA